MGKLTYLTEEGLQKLRDDLDKLVRIERPSISQQIAEARDKERLPLTHLLPRVSLEKKLETKWK